MVTTINDTLQILPIDGYVLHNLRVKARVMVFDATFNNISAISLRSVLLVDETGVPRENHQPAASH
jgi:hypothetical protein